MSATVLNNSRRTNHCLHGTCFFVFAHRVDTLSTSTETRMALFSLCSADGKGSTRVQAVTTPLRFMSLPAELREIIYEIILKDSGSLLVDISSKWGDLICRTNIILFQHLWPSKGQGLGTYLTFEKNWTPNRLLCTSKGVRLELLPIIAKREYLLHIERAYCHQRRWTPTFPPSLWQETPIYLLVVLRTVLISLLHASRRPRCKDFGFSFDAPSQRLKCTWEVVEADSNGGSWYTHSLCPGTHEIFIGPEVGPDRPGTRRLSLQGRWSGRDIVLFSQAGTLLTLCIT